MLKNIISALFVATITLATIPAMANNNPPVAKINVALASQQEMSTRFEKSQSSNTKQTKQDKAGLAAPATGWIFAFSLLSFVLLSNRRGV